MISQVEAKEMVGEAYSLGIEYFIHKPINKIEIVTVLRKVKERIELETSIGDIQHSLSRLIQRNEPKKADRGDAREINQRNRKISFIGIRHRGRKRGAWPHGCPSLFIWGWTGGKKHPVFKADVYKRRHPEAGPAAAQAEVNREIKASEQRIRRAVIHSLNQFASLGTTDFSNPKFEYYASKFFDFPAVSKRMKEMQAKETVPLSPVKVNMKKFIHVFFLEAKDLREGSKFVSGGSR